MAILKFEEYLQSLNEAKTEDTKIAVEGYEGYFLTGSQSEDYIDGKTQTVPVVCVMHADNQNKLEPIVWFKGVDFSGSELKYLKCDDCFVTGDAMDEEPDDSEPWNGYEKLYDEVMKKEFKKAVYDTVKNNDDAFKSFFKEKSSFVSKMFGQKIE